MQPQTLLRGTSRWFSALMPTTPLAQPGLLRRGAGAVRGDRGRLCRPGDLAAPVRGRETQHRAVRLRREGHGAVHDRGRGGDHRRTHQRRRTQHRIVVPGKDLPQHPVELLPGGEAVAEVNTHPVVLDHQGRPSPQEAKVRFRPSDQFRRIEIVMKRTPPPTRACSRNSASTPGAS